MHEKLAETLKNAGYSLTRPRRAVFVALQSGRPHTMRELADGLKNMVDRASVYRTVALFEQLGIVVRLQQGWKYKIELSDQFAPHHHHLTCLGCGRIISFDEPAGFDELMAALSLQHGFTPESHTLEINGYCQQCRLQNQQLPVS